MTLKPQERPKERPKRTSGTPQTIKNKRNSRAPGRNNYNETTPHNFEITYAVSDGGIDGSMEEKSREMMEKQRLKMNDDDNKGLLWKLPVIKSDQFGKVGPAFGIGVGCGLGFGAGFLGGLLLNPPLHLLQFRILVTRCFDISIGKIIEWVLALEFLVYKLALDLVLDVELDWGIAQDENKKYSNVGNPFRGARSIVSESTSVSKTGLNSWFELVVGTGYFERMGDRAVWLSLSGLFVVVVLAHRRRYRLGSLVRRPCRVRHRCACPCVGFSFVRSWCGCVISWFGNGKFFNEVAEEGGPSVGRENPSFSPGGISTDAAALKTYVRKGSRTRFKSRALKKLILGTPNSLEEGLMLSESGGMKFWDLNQLVVVNIITSYTQVRVPKRDSSHPRHT
ncbi:hypothetical protein V8G54_013181 [Vigna mungo]|uniref:Uncharacterized protein n=1 Tax=Vigna mungo TaxID=3915 RepID=A0AAQ3NST1_VIGMU